MLSVYGLDLIGLDTVGVAIATVWGQRCRYLNPPPILHQQLVSYVMPLQWNAASTPAVLDVVKDNLSRLEVLGATVVEITLPELELTQTGHLVTIAKEMAADAEQQGWLQDWKLRSQVSV